MISNDYLGATRAIPALTVSALCVASLWQIVSPPSPRLIYNQSASAPLGRYAVGPNRPLRRGDQVAAFAPIEARELAHTRDYLPRHIPLTKTVWAIGGDYICHGGTRLRVTHRPDLSVLTQDSLGRALPTLSGCYELEADQVFLISTDVQTSWDSRYFGPVKLSDVIGPVRYLGERLARRQGVEGKIKGGRPPRTKRPRPLPGTLH